MFQLRVPGTQLSPIPYLAGPAAKGKAMPGKGLESRADNPGR